jgi:hypothetical protein
MLVHDQYSGYIHEVPDQLYGLGEVYDGLGHPLGLPFLSALAPLASRLLPALAPIVSRIPGVGNLVGGALQNVGRLTQGAGNVIGQAAQLPFNVAGQGISATGQALANLPGMPGFAPPLPAAPFMPGGMPRPWPLGWIRPSLPYTGLGPRRLYMRCAVWPGPQGLVPGNGSPSRRPCRFWRVRSAEVAVDIVVARCPGLVRTIGTIAVNKGCPTSMRCRQTEKAHHWTNASNSRERGVSSGRLLGLRRRRWRRDESIERYRRYWWTWAHCGGWSTRRTTAERGGPTSTSWTSRRGSCAMRTAGNSTCSGEVTASHTGVSKVRGRRTDKRSSLRKGNWRCATSQASTR